MSMRNNEDRSLGGGGWGGLGLKLFNVHQISLFLFTVKPSINSIHLNGSRISETLFLNGPPRGGDLNDNYSMQRAKYQGTGNVIFIKDMKSKDQLNHLE